MTTTSVQTALNVYIPSMPRLRPVILARVHRRRNVINLSNQERQEGTEFHIQGDLREEEGRRSEGRSEGRSKGLVNLIAVNWAEFWKQTRIYPAPAQEVEYADTSEYVSLRHRSRTQERARARANAYVSDTESDSDCENNVVVV